MCRLHNPKAPRRRQFPPPAGSDPPRHRQLRSDSGAQNRDSEPGVEPAQFPSVVGFADPETLEHCSSKIPNELRRSGEPVHALIRK